MRARRPLDLLRLGGVATRETVATVRSALFPLARLHRMAPPGHVHRRPVLLVHGFLGHPDMFRPLRRRLHVEGWQTVVGVRYPSTQLRLPQIVARIDGAARTLAADGPIDVVAHSLGAVSTRAWLREFGGAALVRRFISLGGPHAGTTLHPLVPAVLSDVLDPDGYWVRRLASDGREPVDTVVIRARYDQQVFPPERASLPGIREVVLQGHGHNSLLWSNSAHSAVVDALRA